MRNLPLLMLVALTLISPATAASWLTKGAAANDFPLVRGEKPAAIVVAKEDFKVVHIAAADLAADVARITDRKPGVRNEIGSATEPLVIVGTLGRSPIVDQLAQSGKLDLSDLRGKWESFVVVTVRDPLPNVPLALVIAGSDRRGTAFGVYELAQAIGVSPWHWWADVAPRKQRELFIAAGTRRFGPPSVKYRGIFINDEDWGLQPWAAKTFEPETGDIGPKTYAKVFELLLRLKANTVWPGMHPTTKAFNHYPQNKIVADDYGIVMGSSHAEPMLRNNVGEWKAPHNTYNYVANREGVLKYWEDRVAENGRFENIYTLGMRGIHDSGIQGARTDAERIQVLEQVFADQRALLAKHVRPEIEQVPQMFCAYKEVLGLYRQGLKVPDDVTLVWPDDNFGYIRNFATPEERKRSGGFGIYYHISYLGGPLAYLWLSTTPPALIWEEMTKAYDHGARTIWIVNVGDIKPAEIGMEFFLQVAWDVGRWRADNLPQYLTEWATREFGAPHANDIAAIMRDYYALNFQRRPEHLQWWLPIRGNLTPPKKPSPWSVEETKARLAAFADLQARATRVGQRLAKEQQDAFTELVGYPVHGTALANERYFSGERASLATDAAESEQWLARANAADAKLQAATAEFNEQVAGGKWRSFMRLEPADNDWRSMRIAKWEPPKIELPPDSHPTPAGPGIIVVEAERFTARRAGNGANWQVISGLGVCGDSIAVIPTTMPGIEVAKAAVDAPQLAYEVNFDRAGEFPVMINLLPTHPIVAGRGLRLALSIGDQPPQEVAVNVRDGSPDWAQGVLNSTVPGVTRINVPAAGRHTLRLYALDAGVVVDRLAIDIGKK